MTTSDPPRADVGLDSFAANDPDFVAIVTTDGVRWSRATLNATVYRLLKAFLAAGLSKGDSVAIVSPNCPEYLAVYLAAVRAGLYVVPVNWHLSDDELSFIVKDAEARVVVVHQALGHRRLAAISAMGGGGLLIAIGNAPGLLQFDDFISRYSSDPIDCTVSGRVMPYTSATTGRPKAVRLPMRNAGHALRKIIAWHESLGIEVGADNVHLCTSMLYHSAPLEGTIIALEMGHRVVLLDGWGPESVLSAIDRHSVTTSFMVPTMFVRLLKLRQDIRDRYSTRSLRFVVHSGAPCPPDAKRKMLDWWGPIIWESYGAAEGQGTIAGPQDWLRHPGTVGRPIPGSAIKIVDERGDEVPPLTPGTIYLVPHTGDRFEYKGDPEKTAGSHRGEFITVGDIGYLNDEGYLFICDRSADLIISSGMNIYPAEIEQVFIQHPSVLDCAVVGVPHVLFGQVPKAFIQIESGAEKSPTLTAELLAFAAARLSAMKLPKQVEFVDSLPRTPSGKLYKRLLVSHN